MEPSSIGASISLRMIARSSTVLGGAGKVSSIALALQGKGVLAGQQTVREAAPQQIACGMMPEKELDGARRHGAEAVMMGPLAVSGAVCALSVIE